MASEKTIPKVKVKNRVLNPVQSQIIESFTIYLQSLGFTHTSTLIACTADFIAYHNITNIKQITPLHILSFYDYVQQRPKKINQGGLSDSFIYQHMYSLKVFFDYLQETLQIIINPISNLSFKRPPSNTRQPLPKLFIDQLFSSAISPRETALLHLFYSCGLRRTEAQLLDTADIHFSKGLLYVRKGKNSKRRTIPITKTVSRAFEDYLLQRKNPHRYPAFMFNIHHRRLQDEGFNWAFKKILKRTAFYKDLAKLGLQEPSIHHLRHSIATHLLENGLNIQYVKEFLGHVYLESTQIYAKVSSQQLKQLI
jgi:integrase/recombinase XerD